MASALPKSRSFSATGISIYRSPGDASVKKETDAKLLKASNSIFASLYHSTPNFVSQFVRTNAYKPKEIQSKPNVVVDKEIASESVVLEPSQKKNKITQPTENLRGQDLVSSAEELKKLGEDPTRLSPHLRMLLRPMTSPIPEPLTAIAKEGWKDCSQTHSAKRKREHDADVSKTESQLKTIPENEQQQVKQSQAEQPQVKQSQAEQDLKTLFQTPLLKQYTDLTKFTKGTDESLYVQGENIDLKVAQYMQVMRRIANYVQFKKDEEISKEGVAIEIEKNEIFAKLKEGKLSVFKKLKEIGSGGNGRVYRVVDLASGFFAALKIARKGANNHVRNEIDMLEFIHDNGVKPYIQSLAIAEFDISKKCVGFVSALYSTDLFKKLKDNANLPLTKKINYIKQLLQAMKSLKEVKLWHGDIKLENLWLLNEDTLHLADFDGAMPFEEAVEDNDKPHTFTDWMQNHADVQLLNQALKDGKRLEEIGLAMDLYSASICIYNILLGNAKNPYKILAKDAKGNKYIDPKSNLDDADLRRLFKPIVVDFLARMLNHDMGKRPSLDESIKFWNELDINAMQPNQNQSAAAM